MIADWQENSLEQCLEPFRVPGKIQKSQFSSTGDFPIISQEAAFINGYWDRVEDVCSLDQPVVIFGDHTQVVKYIDFDFVVGADGVKILQPKAFLEPKYLYYFLLANPVPSHGYARHYRHIKEKVIRYPSEQEQRCIVAALDEAFESLGRAYAYVEANIQDSQQLLSGFRQRLFNPQNHTLISRRLGDVVTLQRGFDLPKKLRRAGPFPLVSSSGPIDTHMEAKVVGPGVVTGRSGSIGKVFFVEDDYWPLNTTLYAKNFHGNHVRFVFHLLAEFGLEKFSGGTGVPTLNRNYVHSEIVHLPANIDAQIDVAVAIDTIVEQVDNLLAIYGSKVKLIDDLRHSVLERAFAGELT